MAEDRREDVGRQVTGSIKEAIGKLTGDQQIQDQGSAEKAPEKASDQDADVPGDATPS